MKKIFKKILLAGTVMVATLSAGIFTSCTYGADQEDLKREEGFKYCVTYDANGGTYGSNSTRTYALVKENSPAPAPGYVDGKTQASVKIPTRRDYQLVGEAKSDGDDDTNEETILTKSWFVAKTDEDGNVIYEGEGDEKTAVLERETPWNFAKDRVTEDITLVAQWREVFRYSITLVDDTMENPEKELYVYSVEPGDTIIEKLYNKDKGTNQLVRRADYIKVSASNYTILDFYLDKECTEVLPTDYAHPGRHEDEATNTMTNTVKIYVKYLKGKFDLITNKNIKTLTNASKWYLLENIDCNNLFDKDGYREPWAALKNFTGTIYGNGYTISNMLVQSTANKNTSEHSIFGKMNGTIENLTLDNITMQVKVPDNTSSAIPGGKTHYTAFLAQSFGDNASINGLTLNNCNLTLTGAKYYEEDVAENGLWWESPAEGKVSVTGTVTTTVEE